MPFTIPPLPNARSLSLAYISAARRSVMWACVCARFKAHTHTHTHASMFLCVCVWHVKDKNTSAKDLIRNGRTYAKSERKKEEHQYQHNHKHILQHVLWTKCSLHAPSDDSRAPTSTNAKDTSLSWCDSSGCVRASVSVFVCDCVSMLWRYEYTSAKLFIQHQQCEI